VDSGATKEEAYFLLVVRFLAEAFLAGFLLAVVVLRFVAVFFAFLAVAIINASSPSSSQAELQSN